MAGICKIIFLNAVLFILIPWLTIRALFCHFDRWRALFVWVGFNINWNLQDEKLRAILKPAQ